MNTIEERAKKYLDEIGFDSAHMETHFNNSDMSYYEVFELMKGFAREFAQAKVLEALEKEFSVLQEVVPDRRHTAMIDAATYFKQEVKPKYE